MYISCYIFETHDKSSIVLVVTCGLTSSTAASFLTPALVKKRLVTVRFPNKHVVRGEQC